jgi:Fic family protein
MPFLRSRNIGGVDYYSACESLVENGKTVQKELYYFGKHKPSKSGWDSIISALEGKDVYEPKGAIMAKGQAEKVDSLNKRMKLEFSEMSATERQNFDEKFMNDYIFNTNSIEGSTLTKDETYFVTHENQGVEGKKLKDIYMARNLMNAAKFLDAYDGKFSLSLIRKLHMLVQENIQPREELGLFKKRQNYITGTDFLPTPPNFVPRRMGGLMRWYGKNVKVCHPFELAAIFHIKFVSIHPFPDGNGRTARLLHNFILKKHGILPIIYRTETKQKYYSALRNAQIYSRHAPFLEYSIDEFVSTYEES